MRFNRIAIVVTVIPLVAFLFLVPVISYPIPAGQFNCPNNGCQFLRYGSVTYWAFGVGATVKDVKGYSLAVVMASATVSSTSTVSYSTTTLDHAPAGNMAAGSIAIVGAFSNATSKTVTFEVRDVGSGDTTLANATIAGDLNNTGYTGTLLIDLKSTHLERSQTSWFISPALPGLAVGDKINILARTTIGTFATFPLIVGP